MYEDVIYVAEEGVGILTINLPKVRNALTVRAMQEMLEALNRAEDDANIGAVMITGAGDAFCAGFHLREISLQGEVDGIRDHFRVAALWWHQLLHKIVRLRLPVLAAVNGVAAGGGFGLALASDMAICIDTARFVLCLAHYRHRKRHRHKLQPSAHRRHSACDGIDANEPHSRRCRSG